MRPLLRLRPLWGGLLVLALPVAADAQLGVVDRGELVISQGGRVIGREQFELRRGRASGARDGFTLTSTALYPPGYPEHRLTAVIEFGPDSQPLAGRFDEQRDEPKRMLFRLDRRRVTVRMVTPDGESAREFPGAPGFVVLDDSLFGAHLFPPLPGVQARSVQATGSSGAVVETTDHGIQETAVTGPELRLRHLTLHWNGRVRHLWYGDDGRLVAVEDAVLGVTAIRAGERSP